MSKETVKTKAKPMSTNPDNVVFHKPAFYNLAKLRQEVLRLVARTNGDVAKAEAIDEMLTVTGEFLRVRMEEDTATRKRIAEQAAEATAAMLKEAKDREINAAQRSKAEAEKALAEADEVLKGATK